ncbi:MAG TPA: hypothetical protein VGD37_41030 [Kofleriaceae bacterium]|jgi:hypothetical protein
MTEPTAPSPPTALLEYRSQSHRRARGNFRFRVDRDGGVRVQQNRFDLPDHHGWVEDYPAAAQATLVDAEPRLLAILERGGFFELAAHHDAGQRRDGGLQVLAWHGPRARTVVLDRDKLPGFEALVGMLLHELSIGELLSAAARR